MVLAACRYLRTQGMCVSLITSDPVTTRAFQAAGIHCHSIASMRRKIHPFYDITAVAELASYCRIQKIDLVHTHTTKGGFIGRLASRLAGVDHTVHTVHGFAFHEFSPPTTIKFYAGLEWLAAHWAEKIIFVNEFHRQWALRLRFAPAEKMVVIPNGIPIKDETISARAVAELRASLGISADAFVVGAIGRLAHQKGLEFLLQAMPLVLSRYTNAYLLLVGDGESCDEYEQIAQTLGIKEHVRFTGFQEDVEQFYDISDVVALPSLREGLSVALLEAMRSGKPIVTTDIGPNRGVITHEDNALLVPPMDSEQVAEAIIRLLKDHTLAYRLGSNARQSFLEKFTEDRMTGALHDLYLEILG